MTCNIGTADRFVRFVLGLAIIAAGVYFSSWWGAVGLILVGTAAVNWCPLYVPFGISTCAVKR